MNIKCQMAYFLPCHVACSALSFTFSSRMSWEVGFCAKGWSKSTHLLVRVYEGPGQQGKNSGDLRWGPASFGAQNVLSSTCLVGHKCNRILLELFKETWCLKGLWGTPDLRGETLSSSPLLVCLYVDLGFHPPRCM